MTEPMAAERVMGQAETGGAGLFNDPSVPKPQKPISLSTDSKGVRVRIGTGQDRLVARWGPVLRFLFETEHFRDRIIADLIVEMEAPTGRYSSYEHLIYRVIYDTFANHLTANEREMLGDVCEYYKSSPRGRLHDPLINAFEKLLCFRLARVELENDTEQPTYRLRDNKAETAIEFLKRVYRDRLDDDGITLSDLKRLDGSLWVGLRNWANHGGHNLADFIPLGRVTPGRPHAEVPDVTRLDPSNPVDALALQALRQRENTRLRVQRHRQRTKGPSV